MKVITHSQIRDLGACEEGLKAFLKLFPSGEVEVTEANAHKLPLEYLDWAAAVLLNDRNITAYNAECYQVVKDSIALKFPTQAYEDVVVRVFVRLYNTQTEENPA
jgi:hypothetical protein